MVRPRCPWRMQAIYGDQPPPAYSLTLRFSLKLTAPDVAPDRPRAHADRSRGHLRRHPSRIRGRVRDPCPRTSAWCTLIHGRQRSTGPRVFAAGATGGGAAQGPTPYADLDRRFIVAFLGIPRGSLAGCSALGGPLQTVDVALVDLKLPDGEGSELVAVLRGTNPSVRVLILTAGIEPGLQGRMAGAGATGCSTRRRR